MLLAEVEARTTLARVNFGEFLTVRGKRRKVWVGFGCDHYDQHTGATDHVNARCAP